MVASQVILGIILGLENCLSTQLGGSKHDKRDKNMIIHIL